MSHIQSAPTPTPASLVPALALQTLEEVYGGGYSYRTIHSGLTHPPLASSPFQWGGKRKEGGARWATAVETVLSFPLVTY